MADKLICFNALTGGVAGAMDGQDGDSLSDGDGALTVSAGVFYCHRVNATSGAAESSPTVISPDSNAGNKRWVLADLSVSKIICQAGSAALPSITPYGDPNTGIWYPAANTWAVSTGGTEVLRCYSSGIKSSPGFYRTGYSVSIANGGSATITTQGLAIVHGLIASNEFWDVVICQVYGSATVIGSATIGSPPTRTYDMSGTSGNLKLALGAGGASGTYTVYVTTLGGS